MKQETPRGLSRKVQKTVRLKEKKERLTGGLHLSGLKIRKRESGLVGAREPRWSPAAIHGEAGGSGVTSVFSAPFRVGGW